MLAGLRLPVLVVGVVAMWVTSANALPTDGLVGLWLADEDTLDSIGVVHGSWSVSPTYGTGRFGQAFSFSADGNVVMLPDNSFDSPVQGGSISVAAWLKMPPSVIGDQTAVLIEGVVAIYFDAGGPGNVTAVFTGFFLNRIASGVQINDNEWHHVVITFDQGIGSIFVDGVLRNSAMTHMPTNGTTNRFSGGYFSEISGLVDEVALYDRALTEKEVSDTWEESFLPVDIFADGFESGDTSAWSQ